MKSIAIDFFLFYVCLNLASWFIIEAELLPGSSIQPVSDPSGLAFWSDVTTIVTGSVLAMAAIALKHFIFGGAVIVVVALTWLFDPIDNLINGFPRLMVNMGVPTPISLVVQVLVGFVFLFFFIEFVGGRQVSD